MLLDRSPSYHYSGASHCLYVFAYRPSHFVECFFFSGFLFHIVCCEAINFSTMTPRSGSNS